MAIPRWRDDCARLPADSLLLGPGHLRPGQFGLSHQLQPVQRGRNTHAVHARRHHRGSPADGRAVRRRVVRTRGRSGRLFLFDDAHARPAQYLRRELRQGQRGLVLGRGRHQDRRRHAGAELLRPEHPDILHARLLRSHLRRHSLHWPDTDIVDDGRARGRGARWVHGQLHTLGNLPLWRKPHDAGHIDSHRPRQPVRLQHRHNGDGPQRRRRVPLRLAQHRRQLLDGLGVHGRI